MGMGQNSKPKLFGHFSQNEPKLSTMVWRIVCLAEMARWLWWRFHLYSDVEVFHATSMMPRSDLSAEWSSLPLPLLHDPDAGILHDWQKTPPFPFLSRLIWWLSLICPSLNFSEIREETCITSQLHSLAGREHIIKSQEYCTRNNLSLYGLKVATQSCKKSKYFSLLHFLKLFSILLPPILNAFLIRLVCPHTLLLNNIFSDRFFTAND